MSGRKSNFELLRIVSMVMIVACHYCYYGGALFEGSGMTWIIAAFLKTGGKLGVTCFVLISGYFMCDKEYKISSVFRVALQTMFYSLLAIIIVHLFGGSTDIKTIFKEFFSPIYGCYWFVTAYIGMYLISPFLNIILQRLNAPAAGMRGGVCTYLHSHTAINHAISVR